jgi:hypothetical protein
LGSLAKSPASALRTNSFAAQRRRLAAKGKSIDRKGLARFASIVTPETLLA